MAGKFLATNLLMNQMATTPDFCSSLMRAGSPAQACKLDWAQAYKHIAVRREDHELKVFKFGGRLFGEVMLTFGGTSSAGINDDAAKLLKDKHSKGEAHDNSPEN